MSSFCDITGMKFNRLLAIKRVGTKRKKAIWECKCDCGNITIVDGVSLRNGNTKSCGCLINGLRPSTHNMSRAGMCSEYGAWKYMKSRCYGTNGKSYKHYGGRGIVVCERWLHSFENFLEDMGFKPSKNHSLDRYPDKDGDYEPSNCRWATQKQQMRNIRCNKWYTHNGKRLILADWANLFRCTQSQIDAFLKRGRSFEYIYNHFINKKKLN